MRACLLPDLPRWRDERRQEHLLRLIGFLPGREFRRGVARYGGDRFTKKLSSWEQYLAMAFAQLIYREGLRDIEAVLGAIGPKSYHLGIGAAVARSTLADANENRDWRIFADFAQLLIRTAIKLYDNDSDWHQGCARSVRTGLNDHRSLSRAFSVGQVPQAQGRCQNAHAARSAFLDPRLHSHHQQGGARRQRARLNRSRSRRLLRDGSRLYRFRTSLPLPA
jgi:hypothetical protein